MDEAVVSQRSWARSAQELAEAPLPELVEAGPIVGGTPLRLCYLAAARNATGRLLFEEGSGREYELFFKRGIPVLARSTLPELGLIAWLQGAGALDAAAAAKAAKAGGDPVAALFTHGLLPPSDAFAQLGAFGRAVFGKALTCEHGRFSWELDAALPPGTFPLGEKWELLCEAGRNIDLEVLARRLGPRIDCPVMRAGDGLVPIENLGLNAHETRAVAGFDGTRSLVGLAAAAPSEAQIVYRTGLFLAEVGLASFARAQLPRPAGAPLPAGRAEAPAPPAAPPPSQRPATAPRTPGPAPRTPGPAQRTPGPAPRTPGPALRGIVQTAGPRTWPTDVAGLRTHLQEMEGKNHFEVLGLPRASPPNLIKQAYFQRARAFHPDLAGIGDNEVRPLREAITARLNEAWSCLSDDAQRAAYLADLQLGGVGDKIDVANVLVAEQHFRQATTMVKVRRFADALVELDRAVALNPDEGEFWAWRGFTRFSLALDKREASGEAMVEIDRALALNHRCGPAYLFAARIATVLGDGEGAIKYYKRCLAVDGANLEAQRELRLLESRMSK